MEDNMIQDKDQISSTAADQADENLPPVVEGEGNDTVETQDPLVAVIARGTEAWAAAVIRNSPVSRDTPAYNHLVAALSELPSFIRKELGI
jgi:hypothetical protein